MATVQKRRNGRRNNQEETPNKLKRKNSKILEHVVTQDETPVSNVLVPVEIEEEINPKNNGISLTSLPSPKLQKEQTSTPAVTPSKKSTTPRKRKAKSEEKISDIKTETISADQPVMKEDEQSNVIKKEKRNRNRVLPPRGRKVNNESSQSRTQSQPIAQPQNEIQQEQQTPPPQQPQPEKSTPPIQISQKTRSPSTQKRKTKTLAITGIKEKSLDNVTPAISLEGVSAPVLNEPKEVLKEEQKEINEARKPQKKKARLVIKQKRKRIIKSKETISSGDDDLEDEYIPNDIIKVATINETPRSSLTSHTKPSKKRSITNGMDNNKDLKARVTRQRSKSTNKGKTRGRKKLIRLEDEETERNINKVSDSETIQNEIDEKRDQTSNHAPENRQMIENNEQGREQAEDVDLPFGGRLTADEADTSRTRPDYFDKVRFENAKNKAEAVCISYMVVFIIYYKSYLFPLLFFRLCNQDKKSPLI
jgi:hypothetical protein